MERNELIQIRVSAKEKADMLAKASAVGLKVSEWLRQLARMSK